MAELNADNVPQVHGLLAAIARAMTASLPPENRAAFSAVAPRLLEETIRDFLGCDSVQLTGWAITPSERRARRDRIIDALLRGDESACIASRELVSVQWVNKLRRAMADETLTP